jgi:glycosyltransferase involved in cell wall biosynthesis
MSSPHQPRRVCLLTTGLAVGGAEAQVVFLALNLKRRGWEVSVVSMLPPEARAEELRAEGIPVTDLGMKAGIPDVRAIWRLARYWKTFRPHIVHCHMVHANLLGRITRIVAPVPVLISTAHNTYEGHDWAYSFTDRLSDLTTNVSQLGTGRYGNEGLASSEKLIWVPNGIDIKPFARDEVLRSKVRATMGWEGRFVWLAVGNLRSAKDYPNMLRAFAKVVATRQRCLLAIAGSGKLGDELNQACEGLGINGMVRFLGCRRDVGNLMQAADAYVMSSAWEGLPIALLEAGASGVPAVVTNVGGNAEVIEDERTGFVVPAQDHIALAGAMVRMMSLDPLERQRMGLDAIARIESVYGQNRVLDRWENIYEQLLQFRSDSRSRSSCRLPELGRRQL